MEWMKDKLPLDYTIKDYLLIYEIAEPNVQYLLTLIIVFQCNSFTLFFLPKLG